VMACAVRKLTRDDVDSVRALRREALRLHPEAFSSDPERDAVVTADQWRERLLAGRWFGAFSDGELVGMVAYVPETSQKTAHTGELGSMYVRERVRGGGAADALIQAALTDAAATLEQITLTVNAENSRAIRVYERHGFRVVGRVPDALRVDGRSYDEMIMWRRISTGDNAVMD
jgi:ribosomal protein S18 acetylase RimI-like enzyme